MLNGSTLWVMYQGFMHLDTETRAAELHWSFLFLVNLAPLSLPDKAFCLRPPPPKWAVQLLCEMAPYIETCYAYSGGAVGGVPAQKFGLYVTAGGCLAFPKRKCSLVCSSHTAQPGLATKTTPHGAPLPTEQSQSEHPQRLVEHGQAIDPPNFPLSGPCSDCALSCALWLLQTNEHLSRLSF